jgi:bifunctional UDP-N-acetylglucosamine pyrophosphorylase/glucosamine-1-phosphate N-acetyltransferase
MIGILLAAGRGTRMKSEKPKVLFSVNDEPMAFAPLQRLVDLCDKVLVVIGHAGGDVKAALEARAKEVYGEKLVAQKILFVTQNPPRGTGDAVKTAFAAFPGKWKNDEQVLVLNGDLPLIREETLKFFKEEFDKRSLTSACLSFLTRNPTGFGRIIRDKRSVFTNIREEGDASDDEKRIPEVNSGVYLFRASELINALEKLKMNAKKSEFYLTDILGNREDLHSEAILWRHPKDLMGVNTTFELAKARSLAQMRLQKKLCEDLGVDVLDPRRTYISARAKFLGPCTIGPGSSILGDSEIGAGVEIVGNVYIHSSKIGSGTLIDWTSVIRESRVGSNARIGPMAHLRPETHLEDEVKIGNFVETKKTRMGRGSKAAHLTYLGDADIGEESNIGCGTITCNFDGFNKFKTQIGRRAFIGSDTQLVAPVKIGDDAYVGSGTTVTQDVPSGALALSRPDLVVKEGYAKKLAALKKRSKD